MTQFMYQANDNKRQSTLVTSPSSSQPLAVPHSLASQQSTVVGSQIRPGVTSQFFGLEQRVLGIAALLGREVSLHEVARVATSSPHEVAVTFARAVSLGILAEVQGESFRFVHEYVHDCLVASLDPQDSLSVHARVVTLLTSTTPEQALRRVSHAFIAARRSTEDAAIAVHVAREAATLLQTVDDCEQAVALLRRAIDLHDAAALPGPLAALVVEHAEAVLACGQLAEARPLFHRAAQLAEGENDPAILARAALGLGGMWVREHRLTEEAERVIALQHRALAKLPQDAVILRARLHVRLAAEHVYRGGPITAVLDAVDMTRRTGDTRALAEALSLYHHAIFTPAHTKSRRAVADELIAAAAVAHDKLLSLMGLCWRTADLFLLADPTAHIALTELRLRATTLRCRGILFIVHAMEVMLTIRAGQFTQAEQAAEACCALGTEAGDADALPYYGAHLAAIRLYQGREAELAEWAASLSVSPVVTDRDQAFSTAAALFALRKGEPYRARAIVERLRQEGFTSITPTSSWLLTMYGVIEIAAELQDEQIAQAAYDVLLPYAELPIMASLAVICLGSTHRSLGVAASTCRKRDLALEHFSAAVAANERLGHRPATIHARAELALALLQRAHADDRQRGNSLLQQAMAEAEALDMHGLVTRWQDAVATIENAENAPDSQSVTIAPVPHGGWRIALGKHVATVSDLVGLRYIARLVAAPNQEVPAVALVIDLGAPSFHSSRQEVLDREAITTIRSRIRELRQSSILTPSEQDELEGLTHQLVSATGLGGRVRTFADVPERARTAVRKAVKRAIEQVITANPIVGQHLAARVETGAVCRYRVE